MSTKIDMEQIPYYLTWRIRQEVMYPNESIEKVKLEQDQKGIHFGLYLDNCLIAVVSLFITGESAQFRKLAVLPFYQLQGFGTKLLSYLLEFCKIQSVKFIWCNASTTAEKFYSSLEFETIGLPYFVNGQSFIRMRKSIK